MTPSGKPKYGSRLLAPYQRFQSAKIQKFQYTNKNVKKYLKYFVYLQRLFNDRTKNR